MSNLKKRPVQFYHSWEQHLSNWKENTAFRVNMQGFPVNLVGAAFENVSKVEQPNGP